MTEIEQLKCPNCGGILDAPPGATRVTCHYCGADLAVDLDKQEVMLYTLQQQEHSRDKDRIAEERQQLYAQYMAQFADLRDIDATLLQRQILKQTPVIKYQVAELYRRRDDAIKALAALGSEIAARDQVLNPDMPPTQLPVPARMRPPRHFPIPPGALAALLLVIVLVAGGFYAVPRLLGMKENLAGTSGAGQPAPDPTGTALAASPPPDTGYFYAKETAHSVTIFARPFTDLGGVSALGFPITQAFVEKDPQSGKDLWVQYFEKAVIEYHPELGEGSKYQLSRLGAWWLAVKYPGGTPVESKLPGTNSYKFPQTGYTVTEPFLSYWHSGGEVARFGYPLTPSFAEKSQVDGKSYIVQYFERAVMEYHPELNPPYDVELTPLGTQRLKQLYPSGVPMNAATPVPDSKQ